MLIPVNMTLPMGVGSTERKIRRHVDFRNSVEVANASIDDQSTAVDGFHDVIKQIVADDGPVYFFAKEIHHQHVARLEHVNRALVGESRDATRFRLGYGYAVQIGALGQ